MPPDDNNQVVPGKQTTAEVKTHHIEVMKIPRSNILQLSLIVQN